MGKSGFRDVPARTESLVRAEFAKQGVRATTDGSTEADVDRLLTDGLDRLRATQPGTPGIDSLMIAWAVELALRHAARWKHAPSAESSSAAAPEVQCEVGRPLAGVPQEVLATREVRVRLVAELLEVPYEHVAELIRDLKVRPEPETAKGIRVADYSWKNVVAILDLWLTGLPDDVIADTAPDWLPGRRRATDRMSAATVRRLVKRGMEALVAMNALFAFIFGKPLALVRKAFQNPIFSHTVCAIVCLTQPASQPIRAWPAVDAELAEEPDELHGHGLRARPNDAGRREGRTEPQAPAHHTKLSSSKSATTPMESNPSQSIEHDLAATHRRDELNPSGSQGPSADGPDRLNLPALGDDDDLIGFIVAHRLHADPLFAELHGTLLVTAYPNRTTAGYLMVSSGDAYRARADQFWGALVGQMALDETCGGFPGFYSIGLPYRGGTLKGGTPFCSLLAESTFGAFFVKVVDGMRIALGTATEPSGNAGPDSARVAIITNDGLQKARSLGMRITFQDTDAYFADADHDGLPDIVEADFHTDPTKWDSDGDRWSDGAEVVGGYTNPITPDSDFDGEDDGEERLLGRRADLREVSPVVGSTDWGCEGFRPVFRPTVYSRSAMNRFSVWSTLDTLVRRREPLQLRLEPGVIERPLFYAIAGPIPDAPSRVLHVADDGVRFVDRAPFEDSRRLFDLNPGLDLGRILPATRPDYHGEVPPFAEFSPQTTSAGVAFPILQFRREGANGRVEQGEVMVLDEAQYELLRRDGWRVESLQGWGWWPRCNATDGVSPLFASD